MNFDVRNGGPYDRGSADSFYQRGVNPHYFKGKSNLSEEITDLTEDEIKAYMAGYHHNEILGDFKQW